MKKYFYTDGTNQFGPFTIEELKEKNITKQTYVWFQGMGNWTPAGNIPEMSELFLITPLSPTVTPQPSFNHTHTQEAPSQQQLPPKTWLVESILATLFCCLPFGIIGIVNAAKVESRFYAGDIEGANKAAADAKKWTKIGFFIGLVVGVLYIAGITSLYLFEF